MCIFNTLLFCAKIFITESIANDHNYNESDYSSGNEDADLAEAIANSIKTHRDERSRMTDQELAVDNAYGNNVDE